MILAHVLDLQLCLEGFRNDNISKRNPYEILVEFYSQIFEDIRNNKNVEHSLRSEYVKYS